ncbi:hypothetical protein [Listeria ilorinensis]|uniref:hypothetical protein n=1 Tax=Listeria ilorinensis TaxID=2867439 RepID=UPI001EF5B797|nr:hypothetical protein [Listeria ilorinensis]
MTNKIAEQKFQEAEKLMLQIQEIAIFNPEIIIVQSLNMKTDNDSMISFNSANGSQDDIMRAIRLIVKQLTLNMLKDHPCACIPVNIIEATIAGIDQGIQKAEEEGVRMNEDN